MNQWFRFLQREELGWNTPLIVPGWFRSSFEFEQFQADFERAGGEN